MGFPFNEIQRIKNSIIMHTSTEEYLTINRGPDFILDCSLRVMTTNGKPPYGIKCLKLICGGKVVAKSSDIVVRKYFNGDYLVSTIETSKIIPLIQLPYNTVSIDYDLEINNNIFCYGNFYISAYITNDEKRKYFANNSSVIHNSVYQSKNKQILTIDFFNGMNVVNINYPTSNSLL